MIWADLDWTLLDRLRDGFLNGTAADGPYWRSAADLAHYDFTYAARIGWKWDALLAELRARAWSPPPGSVVDWGCGSGIAGRRVATTWPAAVTTLRVWDHSAAAMDFAATRARELLPALDVAHHVPGDPIGTLVISHVLNELSLAAETVLRTALATATAVLWVEPGTSAVAARLIAWREALRPTFRVLAPCPHQGPCGLLVPGNDRDWCHHFAAPPKSLYADADWVRFGQRAGIDLRSLPYSCLALEQHTTDRALAPLPADATRLLGRPRSYKPYTRATACSATGVSQLTLAKRHAPALHKALEKSPGPYLYRWTHTEGEITAATNLVPPA